MELDPDYLGSSEAIFFVQESLEEQSNKGAEVKPAKEMETG